MRTTLHVLQAKLSSCSSSTSSFLLCWLQEEHIRQFVFSPPLLFIKNCVQFLSRQSSKVANAWTRRPILSSCVSSELSFFFCWVTKKNTPTYNSSPGFYLFRMTQSADSQGAIIKIIIHAAYCSSIIPDDAHNFFDGVARHACCCEDKMHNIMYVVKRKLVTFILHQTLPICVRTTRTIGIGLHVWIIKRKVGLRSRTMAVLRLVRPSILVQSARGRVATTAAMECYVRKTAYIIL